MPLWAFLTKGVCMYLEYLGGERLDSWVTLPNGRHQATDEIITRFKGDDGLRYTFVIFPGFIQQVINSLQYIYSLEYYPARSD